MCLGTYAASYQTSLAPFMFFYSLISGMGVGLAYSTPMQAGWTWFPNRKGLINGLTLFGFGTATFVFNRISTNLFNSGMSWGPMIRRLATIYAAMGLVGSSLVKSKPLPEECEVGELPVEVCEPQGAGFKVSHNGE